MSARAVIEKGVDEKWAIGLEYSPPDLNAGETISAVEATITPAETNGLAVVGSAQINGSQVSAVVEKGIADHDYVVQFKVTTSAGYVYKSPERDAILVKVK